MSDKLRVFVTGATGWIGTALVAELRAAGHRVLGMAHSDAGAARLTAQGVEVHRADLRQPEGLVAAVRACDAVVHLAFHMDFADFAGINRIDREAISVMLDAMAGTGKPFVGTCGTLIVARPGEVAVETDAATPSDAPFAVRARAERLVVDAAARGVRTSVVRLAPTVHGAGDHGFVAMLVALAREKGVAAYLGDGEQRWPAVHRADAARLYRLALEGAPAGSVFHGTAEQGVSQRAIAETIAAGAGVPVRPVAAEAAGAHFGWMAAVVGVDNQASSEATRRQLGWTPREPGLLEDLRASYF